MDDASLAAALRPWLDGDGDGDMEAFVDEELHATIAIAQPSRATGSAAPMCSTSRASCSFPTAATTRQAPPAAAIRGALREVPPNLLDVVVCGDSAEAGIDTALRRHGTPNTIAATPFVPLPNVSGEADEDGAPGEEALTGRLSPEGFRDVVQDNLTHLFRIARKASLINGCQLVLCSPEVPRGATRTTSASPRPTSARPRWTSSLPRWRRLRRPARAVQSRAGSRADLHC